MAWLISRLRYDLHDGLRQFRTARMHSVLLILILALGLAAAVVVFTVVHGVILRPLPFAASERLVELQEYQPARHRDQASFSYPDLVDYRASASSLEGVAGFSYSEFVLSGGDVAERVIGAEVDAGVFPLLGIHPLHGRFFNRGEDGEAAAHLVVLNFALWRRRYAGDSSVVGRSIVLNGAAYTVVGIAPRQFEFPRNGTMDRDVELWIPLARSLTAATQRGMRNLTVLGRLRSGATLANAQADLAGIAGRLGRAWPQTNGGWAARIIPLREVMVGRVRSTLVMLAVGVAGLLCIVGVNAGAATLARVSTRTHALAIRLALGAGRGRVGELLISESVVLALIAGALALPMSAVFRRMLIAVAPVAFPRQQGIAIDLMTAVLTASIALLIGVVTGLAPAWYFTRLDLRTLLADSNRSAAGSRPLRHTLSALVIVQVALATVLLGATASVSATYRRFNRVDPGFRGTDVLTGSIALPGARYATATARTDLTERYVDRVLQLPGVTHAAVASLLPMSGGIMSANYAVVGGDVADTLATAALRSVSSDFFTTVRIPLQSGRVFERSDDRRVPLVAVVNQAFVRQSLAGKEAIGMTIRVAAPGMDSAGIFRVIGVSGDAREKDLASAATPIIYFSNRQVSFPHAVLAVRGKESVSAAALRGALVEIDPSLALDDIATLQDKVRAIYALPIFLLRILAVFATLAMLLVAIGVHASVSYTVAAESRAQGIRVALGATQARILRTVIGRSVGRAALGCAAGLVILVVGTRALPILSQADGDVGLTSGALGTAILLVTTAVATYLPARRASLTDPIAVLQS